MDKQLFVRNYIATFLATYSAINYDMNCAYRKAHNHPVEDAAFLAEQAWEALQKYMT